MNLSTKCNCCSHEDVCSRKSSYRDTVDNILNLQVADHTGYTCSLKVSNVVEVSIKCPFFGSKNQPVLRKTEEK